MLPHSFGALPPSNGSSLILGTPCVPPRRVLFYGDAKRDVLVASAVEELDVLRRSSASSANFLLALGEVAQGILDVRRKQHGGDDLCEVERVLHSLLLDAARSAASATRPPDVRSALAAFALPERVRVTEPEGFVHYAVLPELYRAAAGRVIDAFPSRSFTVLGIRSIGTTLGAVVAAALPSERFFTVRPVGDPFDRRLELTARLTEEILRDSSAVYVVVDEGPGLSGSSFASVAQWLREHGVAPSSIVFLPSHSGSPGYAASEAAREIWHSTRRFAADLNDDALGGGVAFTEGIERIIGGAVTSVRELSGGRWRDLFSLRRTPPAFTAFEKQKYLVESNVGRFLIKFAGVGRYGEEKLRRGRDMHAAGFGSEPLGLHHGFIVQRWMEGTPAGEAERIGVLARATEYLRYLASQPRVQRGASSTALLEMVTVNFSEAALPMERLKELGGLVARLDDASTPIEGDHRMHLWEWIVDDAGRVCKCDALDHTRGHDLVGPQDLMWDVAGLIEEMSLSDEETVSLKRALDELRSWNDAELRFYRLAYVAFEIAAQQFALDATSDEGERALLSARRERLERSAAALLGR